MHKHNGMNPVKYLIVPCPCCDGSKKIINGQWLKAIRESALMDQREFGKIAKASGPYISDIERNRRDCPNNILEAYMRLQ